MLLVCVAAGCVDIEPGSELQLDEHVAPITSDPGYSLTSTTYYPVTSSVNPYDLADEIEAYGPMVAAADFNKDGVSDIAIENNYNAVMVRLGDGNGGFGAEARYWFGSMVRPNAVIATDLNADGNIDLVTSNNMSLSVLLNRGNGSFANPVSYAISGCPYWQPCIGSVTAVDLNGDGKLDLAAGVNGGISVFLGNGNGTFGAITTYLCGGDIHHNSVTAADFTGDGKIDLATGSTWGSSVYLFAGNGNGTFAACTATTVGSRPQSMTLGDFNKDGRPDLATANLWGVSVTVLLNQGNGTFVTRSYPFAGSALDMLFVGTSYIDADDTLDLVVGHQTSIFVMSGDPSGAFVTTHNINLGEAPRFIVGGHCPTDPPGAADFVASSELGRLVLVRGLIESAPCTSGCTPSVAGSTQATSGLAAPGPTGGLTISKPLALSNGDVLYAFVTKNDDVGALSGPAGWTQLGQWISTADDDFTTGVWRRVVTSTSSEPASYQWTHTDTMSQPMSGYIVAVRGANTTTPEDAPVVHADGINDSTPNSPSVTTTSPSALVLIHQGLTRTALSTVVAPAGTTLLRSTTGADRNSGVAQLLQTTPGATGTKTWTNTGGSTGADWHTLTVAVRPL